MHTYFTLQARISPQWLSELRQCGQMFPDKLRVGSFLDSYSMPGQRHSQHTPTSLGQGCMCV